MIRRFVANGVQLVELFVVQQGGVGEDGSRQPRRTVSERFVDVGQEERFATGQEEVAEVEGGCFVDQLPNQRRGQRATRYVGAGARHAVLAGEVAVVVGIEPQLPGGSRGGGSHRRRAFEGGDTHSVLLQSPSVWGHQAGRRPSADPGIVTEV